MAADRYDFGLSGRPNLFGASADAIACGTKNAVFFGQSIAVPAAPACVAPPHIPTSKTAELVAPIYKAGRRKGVTTPALSFCAIQVDLWCAKIRSVATQPPSRAHIHDASSRVRLFSQLGTRQADCVGARWTEPGPTWAHTDRGLTPHAASPDYSGLPNPESSFADSVRLRESTSRDTPDEGSRGHHRFGRAPRSRAPRANQGRRSGTGRLLNRSPLHNAAQMSFEPV